MNLKKIRKKTLNLEVIKNLKVESVDAWQGLAAVPAISGGYRGSEQPMNNSTTNNK